MLSDCFFKELNCVKIDQILSRNCALLQLDNFSQCSIWAQKLHKNCTNLCIFPTVRSPQVPGMLRLKTTCNILPYPGIIVQLLCLVSFAVHLREFTFEFPMKRKKAVRDDDGEYTFVIDGIECHSTATFRAPCKYPSPYVFIRTVELMVDGGYIMKKTRVQLSALMHDVLDLVQFCFPFVLPHRRRLNLFFVSESRTWKRAQIT